MSEGQHSPTWQGDAEKARFNEIIDRFEFAWASGARPSIDDDAFFRPEDPVTLLVELVFVDLYRRLQAEEPVRAEEYFERYPELAADAQTAIRLIVYEYQLRCQTTEGLSVGDVLARFPQYTGPLAKELAVSFGESAIPGTVSQSPGIATDEAGTHPVQGPTPQAVPVASTHVQPPPNQPGDTGAVPAVGTLTSHGRRFRILRPHAEGGLGRVLVAYDEELHREVALKDIKPKFADEEEFRAQFVLEAEVTGAMEHPAVVPVYGLGTYADGRPFYATRLIQGDNLQLAIQQYHRTAGNVPGAPAAQNPGTAAAAPAATDATPPDPGQQAVEFRKLLGRFVDVCHAIAYAHSQGVLHRDLKPGNIMLGKYGETLVVDWGLAKATGRSDTAKAAGEGTIRPPAASANPPTLEGSKKGTLAFMSPEQAAGRVDEFSPATDVYGLGATLYMVLTGQPPQTAQVRTDAELEVVLQKVERGEFPHPRQVKPDIPADLEAICLKAMELKPEERYQDAEVLAEEIEHWLADEPVQAYRESTWQRLGRWARRHRTLVRAALIALLIITCVSLVATYLINEQRAATKRLADENSRLYREQLKLTTEKTKLAEHNLALAKAEKAQRQLAEAERYKARIRLHAVQLRGAQDAMTLGDHGQAQRLLASCDAGLRGWEYDFLWAATTDWLSTYPEPSPVRAVAFGHDGRLLAIGRADGMIRLREASSGNEVRSLAGHSSGVNCLAFSLDGKWLASGSDDATVRVWDTEHWQTAFVLKECSARVNSVAFNRNGKLIAAGCDHGVIGVYDTAKQACIRRLESHHGPITSLAFSPDGNQLASGSDDCMVKLWAVAERDVEEKEIWTTDSFESPVNVVAFGDGGALTAATNDGVVWTIKRAGERYRTFESHKAPVMGLVMRANNQLASADELGNLIIRDPLAGGPFTVRGAASITNLAISPDGKSYAAAGYGGVDVWHLWGYPPLRTCDFDGDQGQDEVQCAAFSPDGQWIVAGLKDESLRFREVVTGDRIPKPRWHCGGARAVDFTPNGDAFVSAGGDGAIRMWDRATGDPRRVYLGDDNAINDIALTADGKHIATASSDGTLRLWDAASATPRILGKHGQMVSSICFVHGGKSLVSGSADGTVRLWDIATSQSTTLCRPGGPVHGLTSNADGTRIAVAASPKYLGVWRISEETAEFEVSGHDCPFTAVRFTLDGTRLISGDDKGVMAVWDGVTGQHLVNLRLPERVRNLRGDASPSPYAGHCKRVRRIAISRCGKKIASCSADGTLKIWNTTKELPPDESATIGPTQADRKQPCLILLTDRSERMLTPDESGTTAWSRFEAAIQDAADVLKTYKLSDIDIQCYGFSDRGICPGALAYDTVLFGDPIRGKQTAIGLALTFVDPIRGKPTAIGPALTAAVQAESHRPIVGIFLFSSGSGPSPPETDLSELGEKLHTSGVPIYTVCLYASALAKASTWEPTPKDVAALSDEFATGRLLVSLAKATGGKPIDLSSLPDVIRGLQCRYVDAATRAAGSSIPGADGR